MTPPVKVRNLQICVQNISGANAISLTPARMIILHGAGVGYSMESVPTKRNVDITTHLSADTVGGKGSATILTVSSFTSMAQSVTKMNSSHQTAGE